MVSQPLYHDRICLICHKTAEFVFFKTFREVLLWDWGLWIPVPTPPPFTSLTFGKVITNKTKIMEVVSKSNYYLWYTFFFNHISLGEHLVFRIGSWVIPHCLLRTWLITVSTDPLTQGWAQSSGRFSQWGNSPPSQWSAPWKKKEKPEVKLLFSDHIALMKVWHLLNRTQILLLLHTRESKSKFAWVF